MAQKVDRLTALRSIDLAITNRSSMERLMTVLLEQIIAQQQVAAAKITLLDSGTGGETLSVSKGLWVPIPPDHQPPHDQEISLPDTTAAGDSRFAKILGETGIRAYFSRPLMIQKDCVGLVELFNRSPLLKDRDWFTFLDTLTGQIVIAIENITLFKGLQTANNNLRSAYNTTIEGWSRALDMRDHETEGHCIRVARTSVELGKKLGLGEQELEALYRGALLHDIGKVAIPDAILLKPGPLTEEEWQIMRLHPQYAHDLLSPIDFCNLNHRTLAASRKLGRQRLSRVLRERTYRSLPDICPYRRMGRPLQRSPVPERLDAGKSTRIHCCPVGNPV